MAIGSTDSEHVQHATRNLELYCSEKFLNVSVDKTKDFKLRIRGPFAQGHRLQYKSQQIKNMKIFRYLGVLLLEPYQWGNIYITRKRDGSKLQTSYCENQSLEDFFVSMLAFSPQYLCPAELSDLLRFHLLRLKKF